MNESRHQTGLGALLSREQDRGLVALGKDTDLVDELLHGGRGTKYLYSPARPHIIKECLNEPAQTSIVRGSRCNRHELVGWQGFDKEPDGPLLHPTHGDVRLIALGREENGCSSLHHVVEQVETTVGLERPVEQHDVGSQSFVGLEGSFGT